MRTNSFFSDEHKDGSQEASGGGKSEADPVGIAKGGWREGGLEEGEGETEDKDSSSSGRTLDRHREMLGVTVPSPQIP